MVKYMISYMQQHFGQWTLLCLSQVLLAIGALVGGMAQNWVLPNFALVVLCVIVSLLFAFSAAVSAAAFATYNLEQRNEVERQG